MKFYELEILRFLVMSHEFHASFCISEFEHQHFVFQDSSGYCFDAAAGGKNNVAAAVAKQKAKTGQTKTCVKQKNSIKKGNGASANTEASHSFFLQLNVACYRC